MRKSLLKKYLVMNMSIVLVSYIFLASFVMFFFTDFWESEKEQDLSKCAFAVSLYVSTSTYFNHETGEVEIVVSDESFSSLLTLVSKSIDADVFITDLEGNVLLGVNNSETDPKVSEEFVVASAIIHEAASGYFSGQGTLGGIYQDNHFSIGVPYYILDENNEKILVGVIFASTLTTEISNYRFSTFQMFFSAAVLTLCITFIMVGAMSYRMIRPLRRMSYATRAFADGDFSVRVPVETSDEVGELSNAFNNMANSLSNSEGIRRSFIANVSHELKTPMTTIGGFIDGILDGTIPRDKQSQYLKIVSDEVKRLSRLVKSMLDLSRIDSGEMKLTPVKFDMTETIFTTLLTFERVIDEKGLEIRGLDTANSMSIDGDKDLLHQVVYNLIENAVKFTGQPGFIQFNLSDTYDRIWVSVENSGQGIPPEDLPLIFDKFYKSDKSRSQDKNGMGLGLYLVKTIIVLHGGDITVESAVNGLTKFEFYLPKKDIKNSSNIEKKPISNEIDIQDVE